MSNYSNDEELKKDIIYFCENSLTMAEALRKVNQKNDIHMKYDTFRKYAKELNVFKKNPGGKGMIKPKDYKQTLSEIFSSKKEYSTSKLKIRLINEGYKKCICEECNLTEWNGEPIPLELHHKDGDKTNNSFENLAILCPNCHSQTDNFRTKNIRKIKEKSKNKKEKKTYIKKYSKKICPICNKNNLSENKSSMCKECLRLNISKNSAMANVSREELKELIRTSNFVQIGKKYGITDNAVRKHCKRLNLPYKTSDIKSYSDEEWKNL